MMMTSFLAGRGKSWPGWKKTTGRINGAFKACFYGNPVTVCGAQRVTKEPKCWEEANSSCQKRACVQATGGAGCVHGQLAPRARGQLLA